jgi:hypothetical protein
MKDRMDDPHRTSANDPSAPLDDEQDRVDAIVAAGPRGAYAVAGVATAVVVAIWFAFYVFAYLPRGVMQ